MVDVSDEVIDVVCVDVSVVVTLVVVVSLDV